MPFAATFFVPGSPIAMGSSRATSIRGRPTLVQHNGSKIKKWQRAIKLVASAHVPKYGPLDCPVRVVLEFVLRPPKKAKFAEAPAARLDVDKMARSTLDALSKMLYVDDSRVVQLLASKVWGEIEGCRITVEECETAQQIIKVVRVS